MKKQVPSRFAAFCRFLCISVSLAIVSALPGFTNDETPIGHIQAVEKKYWDIHLTGKDGEKRKVVPKTPIYEQDTILTVVGQRLSIMMDEGTELQIGPNSKVSFTNWTERDDDHRLRRVITIERGALQAKVKKVYSPEEPFMVENKNGVVAVRGTEFIVEAGLTNRIEHVRALTRQEALARKSEVEVHTLEGEVHFAKDRKGLFNAQSRVSLRAGQTSLIRAYMVRPQPPRAFELARFQKYMAKSFPNTRLAVVKSTTNTMRAERIAHTGRFTPAPGGKRKRGRSIASANPGLKKGHFKNRKKKAKSRRRQWMADHRDDVDVSRYKR